jgi:hypothetical protein
MILHTVTCSQFVPAYNAWEQCTKHITRKNRLTDKGAQRILSREYPGIVVASVQYATFAKR